MIPVMSSRFSSFEGLDGRSSIVCTSFSANRGTYLSRPMPSSNSSMPLTHYLLACLPL